MRQWPMGCLLGTLGLAVSTGCLRRTAPPYATHVVEGDSVQAVLRVVPQFQEKYYKTDIQVKAIYADDPQLPEKLGAALEKTGDPQVQLKLLGALGVLGADAAPAVPQIVKLKYSKEPISSFYVDQAAGFTLVNIGKPAVPALLAEVNNGTPIDSVQAAQLLRNIGPGAREAAPALVERMRQAADPQELLTFADAVRSIDPKAFRAARAKELRPRFVAIADSDDVPRASEALLLLPLLDLPAGQVVPRAINILSRSLKDRERSMADISFFSVVQQYGRDSTPFLRAFASDADAETREAAISLLAAKGVASNDDVPLLANALQDPAAHVREAAAMVLGTLGPTAKEAIPRVENALEDNSEGVRSQAHNALQKIRAAD